VLAAAGLETALEPAVVATAGPEPPRPNEPERTPVAAAMCRMDPEGTVAVAAAAVQEPGAAAVMADAGSGCWQRNDVAYKN